jgi:Zn finger protein HypA/HybF involved in hydrogenase expression
MSENDRYLSRCPVCDSPLELDQERGYTCPQCGWDESAALEDDVWIVPEDREGEEPPD